LRSDPSAEHRGKGCRGDKKQTSVHGENSFLAIRLPDVCAA
jgi:hypothetical protein